MGNAVKLSNGACNAPDGFENIWPTDSIFPGQKLIDVNAPTMISGALSPIARESARITPVEIPGIAAGRT